jgi:hypothetical protein
LTALTLLGEPSTSDGVAGLVFKKSGRFAAPRDDGIEGSLLLDAQRRQNLQTADA